MAKTEFDYPVENMSGAVVRGGNTVHRTRNGRTHTYLIRNPFHGTATEAQSSMRQDFGACVREAGSILNDPALRAEWETRYAAYLKANKPKSRSAGGVDSRSSSRAPRICSTLRGFIISSLRKA